jgi:hypothetical protein
MALFSLLFGGVSLWLQMRDLVSRVASVQQSIEDIDKRAWFRITSPEDGGSVPQVEEIRGITPYGDRNNYIVVSPLGEGSNYYVQGRANFSGSNQFQGRAMFGEADIGKGMRFTVTAVATRSSLQEGSRGDLPRDAIVSNPVTVTRTK